MLGSGNPRNLGIKRDLREACNSSQPYRRINMHPFFVKTFYITAVIVSLITAVPWTLAQSSVSSVTEKRDAEKAWDSLIKAKGGREKLHSITSMVTQWENMTNVYRFPRDEWYFTYNLAGNPALVITDGQKSIQYFCGSSGSCSVVNKPPRNTERQLPFLLETRWNRPDLLRVRRKTEKHQQLDIIETLINGTRVDFAFEPEELLVREVRFYLDSAVGCIYRFSDYKRIDGVLMPESIAVGYFDDDFKGLKKFSPITFSFNVDYDPKIFTHQQKATTADAWKHQPL